MKTAGKRTTPQLRPTPFNLVPDYALTKERLINSGYGQEKIYYCMDME